MLRAHLDFETGSTSDLTAVGVARYAEDCQTRVWGFCWRIGHGPVHEWRPGYPDPEELHEHMDRGGIIVAHSAQFERVIWNKVLLPKYDLGVGGRGWPDIKIEQQRCTMAKARAMNLPGSLEKLAEVLSVSNQKDMEGANVMRKMARPRKINPDGSCLWWDGSVTDARGELIEGTDEKGAVLYNRNMEYCASDVLAETDVDDKVPDLTEFEQSVWVIDQEMQERGVKFDIEMCERAKELVTFLMSRDSCFLE